MRTLRYQPLNTSLGTFLLAVSDQGLCRLHLPGEADWSGWFDRHYGGPAAPGWNPALRRATSQLEQFLAGERRDFDLELDLRGTPFQIGVWNQLRSIPFGETRSYAQVAAGIGRPGSSRAVGTATGRNPIPVVVPCHRVIGSNGRLVGYAGGLELKRRLLELEGVLVPGQASKGSGAVTRRRPAPGPGPPGHRSNAPTSHRFG